MDMINLDLTPALDLFYEVINLLLHAMTFALPIIMSTTTLQVINGLMSSPCL